MHKIKTAPTLFRSTTHEVNQSYNSVILLIVLKFSLFYQYILLILIPCGSFSLHSTSYNRFLYVSLSSRILIFTHSYYNYCFFFSLQTFNLVNSINIIFILFRTVSLSLVDRFDLSFILSFFSIISFAFH